MNVNTSTNNQTSIDNDEDDEDDKDRYVRHVVMGVLIAFVSIQLVLTLSWQCYKSFTEKSDSTEIY